MESATEQSQITADRKTRKQKFLSQCKLQGSDINRNDDELLLFGGQISDVLQVEAGPRRAFGLHEGVLSVAASFRRGRELVRCCSKQETGFLLETRLWSTLWAQRKRKPSFGERKLTATCAGRLHLRFLLPFSAKSTCWHSELM